MWKNKTFKTREAYDKWVAANSHKYQIEQIFVNNGYGVTYKPLRRIGYSRRNPVSADTIHSYNKLKRKSSATLRAVVSGFESERFLSSGDKSDLNAAKRILRERGKKKPKRASRKRYALPGKRKSRKATPVKRSKRKTRKPKVTRVRKNPYEAFVIVGYFWHKAETKFYWTGVNWTNRKSSASQYRYSAEAWREAKQYRKAWGTIYPQLRHVKVERL